MRKYRNVGSTTSLINALASGKSQGGASVINVNDRDYKLMLHATLGNNNTLIVDECDHWLEAKGNVVLSTAKYKFSPSSIYFPGSNLDYIAQPLTQYKQDWVFGIDPFTIDLWICLDSAFPTNGRYTLLSCNYSGTNTFWTFEILNGCLSVSAAESGFTVVNNVSFPLTWNVGEWYHVAWSVMRATQIQSCRMFRNGQLLSVNTSDTYYRAMAGVFPNTFKPLLIGAFENVGGVSRVFKGYMDEIRVVKGFAKFEESFTPATEPYPYKKG